MKYPGLHSHGAATTGQDGASPLSGEGHTLPNLLPPCALQVLTHCTCRIVFLPVGTCFSGPTSLPNVRKQEVVGGGTAVSFGVARLPHLFELLLAGGCRHLSCVACFPERAVASRADGSLHRTRRWSVRLSEEPGEAASLRRAWSVSKSRSPNTMAGR